MSGADVLWKDTLVNLLAVAGRLEDEGQYNLAKLCRAAADALSRREAHRLTPAVDPAALADHLRQVAGQLADLEADERLAEALTRGAATLADGRLPLFDEFPHPYVCRRCGHVAMGEPAEACPQCGAWPGTYQRFMPNYWFDALEPFAALERLRRTPDEVAALLEGLPEDILNRPAGDGGWAIRNTVTHLRDAQEVLAYRLDLFREEEHPKLEAKAVWTWATSEEERPPTTLEIFEAYKASREETLRKLEGMQLADWWRTGQHEEFGAITLRQQVSYFAAHELTHLPQIESLCRQLMRRESESPDN
jgi:uncharacterized damage-inducible protein DinB